MTEVLVLFMKISALISQEPMSDVLLVRVVQSRVEITQVGAKFLFRYESLKSKFSFIRFVYNLMIRCSKK